MAKNIVIMTPKYADYDKETKASLLKAVDVLTKFKFTFLSVPEVYIHAARRKLLEKAMELHVQQTFDYFLWVDSDIWFEPSDITTLAEFIDSEKGQAVSGLYYSRHPWYGAMAAMGNDYDGYRFGGNWPPGRVCKIDASGLGFFMFSAKAAERYTSRIVVTNWFDSSKWFPSKLSPKDRTSVVGEDIDFCKKMRMVGFPVWLNTRVIVKHKGIGRKDWLKHQGKHMPFCPVKIERISKKIM